MAGEILRESVPSFSRRPGDTVMSGPNNSIIVLGRDRAGGADSGRGSEPKAGSIHIAVGRKTRDIDPIDDAATVYVSALSDPDEALETSSDGSTRGVSSAGIVADSVRIVAREDLKVVVGRATLTMSKDGSIVIEGDIKLGRDAAERAILGDTFMAKYLLHKHPVPNGVSGPVMEPDYRDALSSKVRVSR